MHQEYYIEQDPLYSMPQPTLLISYVLHLLHGGGEKHHLCLLARALGKFMLPTESFYNVDRKFVLSMISFGLNRAGLCCFSFTLY